MTAMGLITVLKRRNSWLAVFMLLLAAAIWIPGVELQRDVFGSHPGEALLQGIYRPDLAWSMPLQQVLAATLKFHMTPALAEASVQALAALALALMFALALQFGNLLTAAGAVLLAALLREKFLRIYYLDLEQLLYTIVLMSLALALSLRNGRKSLPATVVTAVLVGLALMIRSPLALFPILLAAQALLERRKLTDSSQRMQRCAILLILPFLLLLPRVWMAWKTYGSPSLFEQGRADNVLVSGALGMLSSLDHARVLAGLGYDENIHLWFLQQVAAHPIRFLVGILKRLHAIFSLMPLLYAAAAAAVWRFRKQEKMRMPALLAAYVVLFHSLFGIDNRYFLPLCPLLLSLASALPLTKNSLMSDRYRYAAKSVLAFSLSALLLLYAVSASLLLAYPARSVNSRKKPYAAAEARPGNAWLQYQASSSALAVGRMEKARIFGGKALQQPGEPAFLQQYLMTLVLSGADISAELRKLRRSEASGILYECDETQFALPKLLNHCLGGKTGGDQLIQELFSTVHAMERSALKNSGAEAVALLNKTQLNREMLDILGNDILALPPVQRCFAARCLNRSVPKGIPRAKVDEVLAKSCAETSKNYPME